MRWQLLYLIAVFHTAADEWDTDEDVNNVVSAGVSRGAHQFLLAMQYGMMRGCISREGEEPHLLRGIPCAFFSVGIPEQQILVPISVC